MGRSGDAREYLEKLYSCIQKIFYSEIEATKRGFGFVLSYLEHADFQVSKEDLETFIRISRQIKEVMHE